MTTAPNASVASQGVMRGSFSCARCSEPVVPYRKPREGELVFCRGGACRRAFWEGARRNGKQLALGLTAPIARTTDPVTSHIAAHAVTESGSRASHCLQVLQVLLEASGPLTYREVAARLPGWEAVEVNRRLDDLRKESPPLAVVLPKRVCRVGGNPCQTWQAAARAA